MPAAGIACPPRQRRRRRHRGRREARPQVGASVPGARGAAVVLQLHRRQAIALVAAVAAQESAVGDVGKVEPQLPHAAGGDCGAQQPHAAFVEDREVLDGRFRQAVDARLQVQAGSALPICVRSPRHTPTVVPTHTSSGKAGSQAIEVTGAGTPLASVRSPVLNSCRVPSNHHGVDVVVAGLPTVPK